MKKATVIFGIIPFIVGIAAILVVIGQGVEHSYPRSIVPSLIWACSWVAGTVIVLLIMLYEKGFEHGKKTGK